TSVNLEASTLRKGASARRASPRAISVLPTPVGPIIRMFFGRISRPLSGESCWRRQRFRSATATARLARFWPMTYLASSATIWRGVRAAAFACPVSAAFSPGIKKTIAGVYASALPRASELFERDVAVGVDVDAGGDEEPLARDLGGREVRAVLQERPGGGEGARAAGADGERPLV